VRPGAGVLRMVMSGVAAAALAGGLVTSLAFPAAAADAAGAGRHGPRVLLVGTFHGVPGRYRSVQAAVNAARPGDWILVGPGDYHENADETGPFGNPAAGAMGGVYISKSGITLRGMNRNTVIVDGTKAGSAACSSDPAAQDYGRAGARGARVGRNGILVWKASDVSVENLTVCNFLAGTGASGNQVWWNGGADSGKIGLTGYWGSYLTATSTFFGNETTAAEYGIFAGNSAGPASLTQLYGSNMNDSGVYVGACLRQCDVVLNHLWMENNALGYSGTNSGGTIVIENSQFDGNQDGLDTNTAVIGDPPERRGQPDHPHDLLLGADPQLHPRQQQRHRAGRGQRGGRADRHRLDDLGRPLRHGHGQHDREQRRVGRPVRPLRPEGHAQPGADLHRLRRA
jgi:hypothetical protein